MATSRDAKATGTAPRRPHPKLLPVAVDIEKRGPSAEHSINAVGFAYRCPRTQRIVKRAFYFKGNDAGFQRKTQDEFWSRYPDLLRFIEERAADSASEWKRVDQWLDELARDAKTDGYEVLWVSDNPAYDVGAIDAELLEYLRRLPLRYDSEGEYRRVRDTTAALYALGSATAERIKKLVADTGASHTHHPEDDAEVILRTHLLTQALVDARNEYDRRVEAAFAEARAL